MCMLGCFVGRCRVMLKVFLKLLGNVGLSCLVVIVL